MSAYMVRRTETVPAMKSTVGLSFTSEKSQVWFLQVQVELTIKHISVVVHGTAQRTKKSSGLRQEPSGGQVKIQLHRSIRG